MFIQKVQIKNYRLFSASSEFNVELNVPDNSTDGSGLTVFVGENGCGKSALLDAIVLPIVQFKAEMFNLSDFNDPAGNTEVIVFSKDEFAVGRTMPRAAPFKAKGLLFKANVRSRESRTYLSSIVVNDQLFIKADGVAKPEDGNPDLRVNVNNPFSGKRFDENDVLILDDNRTYQTRSGTYNPTRFDRLMEDFDFQYIKQNNPIPNIHEHLDTIRDSAENIFLKQAIEKFKIISNEELSLRLIDNWRPFSKGFLATVKPNYQQIHLRMLGSGYEMVFSFLLSFYLSQQSGKQLICLIDEPELHLHPSLQEKFINLLLEFSKTAQVIAATHSPLFVKQLLANRNVKIQVLRRNQGVPEVVPISSGVLPYVSANEINYLAFNFPTIEYHDELYGLIMEMQQKYTEDDIIAYLNSKGQTSSKIWNPERKGQPQGDQNVPLQVFIRNKIHHPENMIMQGSVYSFQELKQSIDSMIQIIRNP